MMTIQHRMSQLLGGLVLAGLLGGAVLLQAQPTAHYPPGIEGIKAASLPPPGFYFRDYNVGYVADRVNDKHGADIGGDPELDFYANVPRLVWITDLELLGGNIGVDALVPVRYTYVKGLDQTFTVGDFFAEGTWSMHLTNFDFSFGAGFWAPTGAFDVNNPTKAGLGYWAPMLTAGATWYVDAEKYWAFSVLNRYEFNMQQEDTDITPGDAYTLEWGLSRTLSPTVELGLIGYYQQQVTGDRGPNTGPGHDRVAGVGPEISVFYPRFMLGWSLRYAYEFMAENRFQGNTVALTITKRF
jgi:hypothetical protein